MPKIVKGMTVKEARIEEIVSFDDLSSLEAYVKKQKSKVLYDINFGFGLNNKSMWSDEYTNTAVRYTPTNEMIIHICFPYNQSKLDRKGLLCAGL